jgi:hypothetical protein
MPLYSCHRCGWATTASWRQAVPRHASGSPGCGGTIELVRQPAGAAASPAAGRDGDRIVFLRPAPVCGGGNAA